MKFEQGTDFVHKRWAGCKILSKRRDHDELLLFIKSLLVFLYNLSRIYSFRVIFKGAYF